MISTAIIYLTGAVLAIGARGEPIGMLFDSIRLAPSLQYDRSQAKRARL
jgi:hypothetical protein